MRCDRRQWLRHVAAGTTAAALSDAVVAQQPMPVLPVAGVVTVYRRNSHADVLLGKILEGYQQDGGPGPGLKLVSLYCDQVQEGDLSRSLADRFGFRLTDNIAEALTLGSDGVGVAGVLSIGEHGDYPRTANTRQRMYPRRRFFDEIVAAMQQADQFIPTFNDKHLSYRWDDARHMVDTARRLNIPFMAGSSLPVTRRRPALELPPDGEIEAAVAIGYGDLEAYGFHALEMLQCVVEQRRGGETGVAAVETFQGNRLVDAERQRRCRPELVEAALQTMPDTEAENLHERLRADAAIYAIDYRDGLQADVLMANGVARHFALAIKLKGRDQPLASWFQLQEERPFGHFAYQLRAIEHMLRTGRPAYPVERTLLTTGVLERAMHSLAQDGRRFETPHLQIAYQPTAWPHATGDW